MCRAMLKSIQHSLDMFAVIKGEYPTTEQGLKILESERIINQLKPDPWRKPLHYESPGENGERYRLWSGGPDGASGTLDDIEVPAE